MFILTFSNPLWHMIFKPDQFYVICASVSVRYTAGKRSVSKWDGEASTRDV